MPSTITAALVMYAEVAYATAAAITNFVISTAVSFVVSKVFGPKLDKVRDSGVRQQVPPSSTNSIPIAYGDAWMGGAFVDAVLSTDQKTMYYVLVISHISPNGQFTYDRTNFYYGDRKITFDTTDTTKVVSLTDGNGNADTKISGYMYVSLYTSTAAGVITNVTGSAPSTFMGGTDIDIALRWPSTGRQMNGLAFAIVKLIYNQEAGVTGLQPLTFKISHYLNGTGAAKPGDVFYDYLTNDKYGAAIPAANVNSTECAALNTYSDQTISYTPSGGGSATQVRYRINGVIDTAQPVLDNIEKIVTACDCWLAFQATTAQWMPIINKSETAAFAFNDSNIIGSLKVSMTDLMTNINQIEASFPFKGNKDQPEYVYKELTSGLYINEPENKVNVTFDLVNDSVQAQYLANRILLQSRDDIIVSFDAAYPCIQVNVGEVVSITNSDYGWSSKLFRVMKVSEAALADGNLGARFELVEYSDSVYTTPSITQYGTVSSTNYLPAPEYFSALSAPTVGDQLPSNTPATFSVSCTMPTTGRVITVKLFYTTAASPGPTDWQVWGAQSAPSTTPFVNGSVVKFTNVILPIANYYFAFQVSNETGTSALSATSSVLAWQPGNTAGVVSNFYASGNGNVLFPGTATATIRFVSNGTIQVSEDGGAYTTVANWYLPTTTNIGSSPGYWLYATVVSGSLTSGTTGSWIKLDTNRDYTRNRTTIGTSSVSLSFQISSASGGTPVVGYGTADIVSTVEV